MDSSSHTRRPANIVYADLVDIRIARGVFFKGPCAIWFRLRHPLLESEEPGAYQRVAVAADSGKRMAQFSILPGTVFSIWT